MSLKEFKFLVKLISNPSKIQINEFNNINYENFIKISSSHLMLPAIYSIMKREDFLKYIPKDLNMFLKEIYRMNKERNVVLKKEILEISKFLNEHDIKYTLIKGSSMIMKNIFIDIGERMVGDIDILINEDQADKVINLLNKKGYFNEYLYKFWDSNVYPNFINKKRFFSLDIHKNLLPKKYKNLISSSEALERSINLANGVKVLNNYHEINYLIYNYQLCDFGYLRANYSIKKLYDIQRLSTNNKTEIDKNKYSYNFFEVLRIKGINFNSKTNKKNWALDLRIKMRKKSAIYNFFDKFTCDTIIFFKDINIKIIEFTLNRNYRIMTIKKLLLIIKK
tara:strand:- start:2776 stop:3786 length:1011 start_codon:yes stop_codon:yes gene_type:complete